jgi:hypothetical protein
VVAAPGLPTSAQEVVPDTATTPPAETDPTPPADPPAATDVAPSEESTVTDDAPPEEEPAPDSDPDPAPEDEPTLANDPAPANDDLPPAEEPAPEDDLPPAEELAPEDDLPPAEEPAPEDDLTTGEPPVDDPAPEDDPTDDLPVDDPAPEDDPTDDLPADEPAPEDDPGEEPTDPDGAVVALSAPVGLVAIESDGRVIFGWVWSAAPTVESYLLQQSARPGEPFKTIAVIPGWLNGFETTDLTNGPESYVVVARDAAGNLSPPSPTTTIVELASLQPDPILVAARQAALTGAGPDADGDEGGNAESPDDGSLTEAPTGPLPGTVVTGPETTQETFVYGSVDGAAAAVAVADGQSQRITETLSGGFPAARHDRLFHRWILPMANGAQQLHLVASADPDPDFATGDGDGDSFAFDWSTDRVTWERLAVIEPGQSIDEVFPIGVAGMPIHVRVVDTDRTPRNQNPGAVSVDLITALDEGVVVEAGTAPPAGALTEPDTPTPETEPDTPAPEPEPDTPTPEPEPDTEPDPQPDAAPPPPPEPEPEPATPTPLPEPDPEPDPPTPEPEPNTPTPEPDPEPDTPNPSAQFAAS